MKIEQKKAAYPGIDLQWKIVDKAQGIIKGYLSVFNNVDSTNDRVRPGAYKKTIADAIQRKTKQGRKFLFPLLWMHDAEKPIGGFIDAIEDKYGLLVTAQLDISTNEQGIPRNPLAMSVFSGFDEGYIDELSIGYKALQKAYDNTGVRDLTEIQLFEGSAVTMNFAANDLAQVSSVKANSKMPTNKVERKDFNERYRQQCIDDWMYGDFNNLMQALKGAIMDIFAIGDEPGSDVLSTILNGPSGFNAALEAYVQKGIDLDVSSYMTDQNALSNGDSSYMSRAGNVEAKAGAMVSASNADRLKGHVATIAQVKDMLSTVSEDLTHYVTGGPAYNANDKTSTLQPSIKTLETDAQPSNDTPAGDEDLALLEAFLLEAVKK